MSNELPTLYQEIYYIYFHVIPETEEIVYIGKGSRGRAWHCAESNSRGEEHAKWMTDLIFRGYTPDAWVRIIESGLSEEEALEKELVLIHNNKPIFNSKRNHSCKLDDYDLKEIKRLRELGYSYDSIGKEISVSTMTIYRALNGITKNYGI